MLIKFFLLLKNQGLPVSLKEFLDLLEAMQKNLAAFQVENFYYLSRAILIKHEQHFDRFDQLFAHYFKGIELIQDEDISAIPEEWLRKHFEENLTEEEKKAIEAMGGLEKLMERFRELMNEQKERHQGGSKWIGTGGTSPFGAYGYNPEGYRIGQAGSRHRKAVKVWDKRQFKDLDESTELGTRHIKKALKNLRVINREGIADELDLETTIKKTSENAGMLDLKFIPSKANRVKVLLFFDVGGSMDDHILICNRLFAAARSEFSKMEFFYFHNCIYESVWKDNDRRDTERINTFDLLHKFNSDYKVIIVGDAAMSPYELMVNGGSVEHFNDEKGITWLQRIKNHFPYLVWINPMPVNHWPYYQSVQMLKEFSENRMFPSTIEGLSKAMKALLDKKIHQD
ncbi:MAG: VWA domain-containing protein [Chitinophagaceae bacterium]|nr:MAG: VWA domain-containing protein [Chitinophagaceae bacterium]